MNEADRRRFEELKAGGLLPSPRGVALSVLDLTGRPDTSAHDITRLVQVDPAMAGRILRYANAAHGGALRHIASLQHAITFLGLFRVRQIALGFSLIDQYRSGACPAFDYTGYWAGSLATAIAAQKLAALAQSPPDESFTCGLLAAVGRLALATAFPKDYADLLHRDLAGPTLIEEERARFGIDHRHLSAEMLKGWGLPEIFTEAVRHYEQPAAAPFPPGTRAQALTATLHLAAGIGELLSREDARRWERVPSLYHAAALAGLATDELPPLLEEVAASWKAWAAELSLPTRDHADLRSLLTAPPTVPGEKAMGPALAPLRALLIDGEATRARRLAGTLRAMGLQVEVAADDGQAVRLLAEQGMELVLVDVNPEDPETEQRFQRLREAGGPALHLIVLIPAAAEASVARLLLLGASDYLIHGCSEAALVARLATAQQLVTLRSAVRAERELAVSASDDWGKANRRLLQEALTDPLTRLPNRRYGMDRFAQEWAVAGSNRLPIACMMLDIDHFKRVNDEHGHDIGDLVLQQMAAVVGHNCRRSDVVFRYGGEEFCCICPNTGLAEAIQLGERIAAAVRKASFGPTHTPMTVTLSIGLAVRTDEAEPAQLLARADKALYAAKAGGRDRVVAADAATVPPAG